MYEQETEWDLQGQMISARFRIQLPDHLWVSELSRQFPQSEFKLLSGFRLDDRALELGEVVTDTPADVVETMQAHPAIESYELLESDSGRVLGKYETKQTDLYEFAEIATRTIEFPISVRRGWYTFDLTGTREDLDELRAVLDGSPLSYELESLVSKTETDSLLTERQREVIEAAARMGYFTVPRECTLAELAESLDVDKSTASTVLRRAQQRLVEWFLAGPEPSV
jgi:predicted DNA binding protein